MDKGNKKKSKNYCRPKLSDTCLGSRINLVCTDYDGILPEGSAYDEDDCLTGQDIIEDIIIILDQHTEELDVKDFGCCLEYEASDKEKGLVIKDILSKHESAICHILETCCSEDKGCGGDSSDSGCKECSDLTVNETGLVFNTTGVGNISINNSFNSFNPITSYALNYKTKIAGTYKITVDLDYVGNMSSSENFEVGITIDGQAPDSGAFNKDTVKVANNTKTLHFIVEVNKGVNLNVVFKKAPTATVVIEKAKVITEKVK